MVQSSRPAPCFSLALATCALIVWAVCGATLEGSAAESAAKSPSFKLDVMAVLSRAGCNQGACHGNLNGKGGLSLSLRGEANDYVGKGLSGGEIVLRPRRHSSPCGEGQVIAGNTILYGATSGRFFAAGRVGERFAVRLSGALAVVEGVGDHACEYMTAGTVLILGPVGHNLGAGMSGGLAYVHDPGQTLAGRINAEMVSIDPGLASEDETWLLEACRRHWEATASPRVGALLEDWAASMRAFRRVAPRGLPSVRPGPWPADPGAQAAQPEPMWSVA